ncbi:MAG TPA: Gmad2 immunoglobulin-like domain-containing protein [Acidimicrobiia bacterium]
MTRLVLSCLLLALVIASCGSAGTATTSTTIQDTTTSSTQPASSTTPTTTTSTMPTSTTSTTTEPVGPYQQTVFMLHDSGGNASRSGPFLAPVVRNTATLEETSGELLLGLTSSEAELGITTAIPSGTHLNGIEVEAGVATVDLSSEFGDGGGTLSMRARLAQLVFTVTGYDPAITGVRLQLEGSPVEVFSGEGLILDDPMIRQSFRELMPGILVESPAFEEWVPPPVVISGIAAAFEGVFQLEILDAAGELVADVPYVQTTDAMDWGYFSVTFEAEDLPPMPADLSIRVYELWAKDGSVINERIQPFGYRMEP